MLGFDRSVVAKAESGRACRRRRMCWRRGARAYGLDGELFARLAGAGPARGGPVPAWFESWLEAEAQALDRCGTGSRSSCPGLFQTAEYARALLLAAQTGHQR